MLNKDIARAANYISGGKINKAIGLFRSPGVHAVIVIRFGQWLLNRNVLIKIPLTPLYLILYHRIRSKWGIEIPRKTQIGEGFYIGHYGGITISSKTIIGKNVNISQDVTIGLSGKEERGCPIIGDNVYIAPGAKIFGKITIGNNVKIGANAVVHKDVPDNAVVVLSPGFKILSYEGNKRST